MVITTRVRERLYGDDRRRGDQQRRRRIPRALRDKRPPDARRNCRDLGILLGGIAYLATSYGIMAMDQTQPGYQSVLSQLVGACSGTRHLYYVAIASALCVLCLSASTSFVGLPRLYHVVARMRSCRGRLAPSDADWCLRSALSSRPYAGLLLTVFDGITDRLIPLFAIGRVF